MLTVMMITVMMPVMMITVINTVTITVMITVMITVVTTLPERGNKFNDRTATPPLLALWWFCLFLCLVEPYSDNCRGRGPQSV